MCECPCFALSSGVKFSPSTKEFTVSVPNKGNAVFNMDKKVKTNEIRLCRVFISPTFLINIIGS